MLSYMHKFTLNIMAGFIYLPEIHICCFNRIYGLDMNVYHNIGWFPSVGRSMFWGGNYSR